MYLGCSFAWIFVLFYFEQSTAQVPPYQEKYYDQTLDHFNFVSYADNTFKQRYLINDTWWNHGKGPIFFYTGNEGPIDAFWNNTGFVFDIAPQFGALVVFAEHRYYGKSLPFGADTFKPSNMGLLTVEQALADYAVFIQWLKKSLNSTDSPVICFGGSYGGMLSAFIRFKYPNIVKGSIAASAPIYLLSPHLNRNFFFDTVTATFDSADPNCVGGVKKAFSMMQDIAAKGMTGLKQLSNTFRLCKPLTNTDDYTHLLGWVRNSFSNLAMFDYPYPTMFDSKLPAKPVNVACKSVLNAANPVDGLAQAAGLYYNGTDGQLKCFDIFSDFVYCADQTGCGTGTTSMAWDFQACTEIDLVNGSNNMTDMFPAMPFTPEIRNAYCKKRWNVTPRDNWGMVQFWDRDLASASNIVFSNGDLDPWKNGGVKQSVKANDIQAITVEGGAHHLDLRGHNPADPTGVMFVREVEKQAIRRWINSD